MKAREDKLKEMDEIFDDKLLEKSMKKAKRRARRRTVVISIIVCISVFIVGGIGNILLSIRMADKFSDARDVNVSTSIPNGYVSEARDAIGFLGGKSEYKLAKEVGGKVVVIENEESGFGMINNFVYISRYKGLWGNQVSGWPEKYWENGDKKMLFFHPEVEYKEYKNDLPLLEGLSDMQIIEIGLSFDKGYDEWAVGKFLKDFNITWVWIDNYSEEQLDSWRNEIARSSECQSYIVEGNTFGININGNIINQFDDMYKSNVEQLKEYNSPKYDLLQAAGLDELKNAKIIGVTVQGTPEELKALSEVKEIKGATIGCVVNTY